MSDVSNNTEPAATRRPSPLELQALKALWTLGSGTVADVRDALEPERELAYTTVLTLLDRLEAKGAVQRRKKGRGYVYRPELSREAALERALERLASDFFQGSREQLSAYLQDGSGREPSYSARSLESTGLDSALL
ncbi:MAG: BlaI/MecI/CopY family transcriptional regulator [Acidobacteria bacterium]|nr:BlaI/MecI/CopY family transcriptional regulator [Acidobacteriota bacterium]